MMPVYLYTTPAMYKGEKVMIDASMLLLSYPPRYKIQYPDGRIDSASVREVEILREAEEPPMGSRGINA
jgi:hypothetical protein